MADLNASITSWDGAAGSRIATVEMTYAGPEPCSIPRSVGGRSRLAGPPLKTDPVSPDHRSGRPPHRVLKVIHYGGEVAVGQSLGGSDGVVPVRSPTEDRAAAAGAASLAEGAVAGPPAASSTRQAPSLTPGGAQTSLATAATPRDASAASPRHARSSINAVFGGRAVTRSLRERRTTPRAPHHDVAHAAVAGGPDRPGRIAVLEIDGHLHRQPALAQDATPDLQGPATRRRWSSRTEPSPLAPLPFTDAR